jgi:hypothetical protein
MKTLLSTLFVIAMAANMAAAEKPNFSGTWKLDVDKSSFGPMPPLTSLMRTIEQKDPDITVKEASTGPQGEQNLSFKYSTDGKETINTYMGNELRSKAGWDGRTLVVHNNIDVGGEKVTSTEKWTLSDDGKTFNFLLNISTSQGDLDLSYVLVKQ